MKVVFDHSEVVAHGIHTFYFKPERPLRYTAGQFIELYLPHKDEDSRGHKRWFTLSSSPTEPLLAITTRLNGQGSSFKRELQALTPGQEVMMVDPMGDFVLPKDRSVPLVFVSAGLGVTPMRSMVKWLTDKKEQRTIDMFYLTRAKEQLAFSDMLKTYVTTYTPVFRDVVLENLLVRITPGTLIYIAGPEQFVESLHTKLLTKGIAPERIVGDYFPGYASLLL